jgi:formamidopyrimidine-DNA glycosylase
MAKVYHYNHSMPELPEVHTTATGLQKMLPGLEIIDVWTDYKSHFYKGKENIKNEVFFKKFRDFCIGKKIISVERRAKNVLIHLSDGQTILIHMKMTGHLLYGKYRKNKKSWQATEPGPLRDDPFNARIHFVITLSNGKHVALSDTRKFAKVTMIETRKMHNSPDLGKLGPEPTDKNFTFDVFKKCIEKKINGKIKTILMDQSVISGIGNIYSDEILWECSVHPESKPKNITKNILEKMYHSTLKLLSKGIDFGGDSMSDYRNIYGEKGRFQLEHKVYRRVGEKCKKRGCDGEIQRKIIGGRSAHFCSTHQKLLQ